MADTAVLLMNYGGPEGPDQCEEYIRNIFLDPDLIPIPFFARPWAARAGARRRAPLLQKNYEAMGQYSPILAQTNAQAAALEEALGTGYKCFVGMRYLKPMIADVCREMVSSGCKRIVLLPLFPQESQTTTGTCIAEARRSLKALGWKGPVSEIGSFWDDAGFLDAMADGIRTALNSAPEGTRLLFSAHGLPVSVARKDPYPAAVTGTCLALCAKLDMLPSGERLSERKPPTARGSSANGHVPAYLAWQSKVGPMKWLEPGVESVLEKWSKEDVRHIVLVSAVFVSEHSETLYELDVLYTGIARELGMSVQRVPTVQSHPRFIAALADKVRAAAP